MRLMIVGENSSTRTAFVAYPINGVGIGIDEELKLLNIWMAVTAPTKTEVKTTNTKEFTPRSFISLKKRLMKTDIFCGVLMAFPSSRKYSPKAVRNFLIILRNQCF